MALTLLSFDLDGTLVDTASDKPCRGVHAALQRLQVRGVRLACVTNHALADAGVLLQRHDLRRHFELVIGRDSLLQSKPHASVLRYVADTLGVPRECMAHVGDSAVDVMAARNAGVRAWTVPRRCGIGRPSTEVRPDLLLPDLGAVAQAALDIPAFHQRPLMRLFS
jgi:phosphoglycolate phosphatase